ncbi:MCE family protein [Oryzihumus leptocrescens]|uniref:Phospholipid/cholesterol/gamma-HCH transport system substrate-binding protein n=1 Tax=Oryzihumus leptocrescens TaxID=297536 RepID=A0A542ZMV7_9MICO|nr:MCE family protein [Oryzihumus leptocrescens]TQL61609.1 phospholipid/cholesterol/gamma-HCH transport system substrate-binding protein [Oryzihumus leptocrescens]
MTRHTASLLAAASRIPRRGLAGLARTAVAVLAVGSLAACQGAYDLPLPGGAAQGGDVYHVTAEFADVLDLVPQSAVKVDEVTVGAVEKIELNGWTARVTLRLPKSVKLPDNAIASLHQTSLLGEKYVELAPPTDSTPEGSLSDGDNIPIGRTGRNPEVEEVLSAMSLLLNGGGVAQLKVIETELNKAMNGNESQIRDLVGQLDTFVSGLDKQKSEIVRAIEGIDRLSARIAARKDDLAKAVDTLPQGLKVLADQRRQLTTMLESLSRLGAVGTKVINASQDDTVANLKAISPILSQLNRAGDDLPKSMQLLLTYPFPDEAVKTIKGDYTNLWATADMNLGTVSNNLGLPTAPGGKPTGPGLPSLPSLPKPTLSLPQLPGGSTPSSTTSKSSSCSMLICLGAGEASTGEGEPSWLTLFQTGGAA